MKLYREIKLIDPQVFIDEEYKFVDTINGSNMELNYNYFDPSEILIPEMRWLFNICVTHYGECVNVREMK